MGAGNTLPRRGSLEPVEIGTQALRGVVSPRTVMSGHQQKREKSTPAWRSAVWTFRDLGLTLNKKTKNWPAPETELQIVIQWPAELELATAPLH